MLDTNADPITDIDAPETQASASQNLRIEAIRQIERKRRFKLSTAASAVAMVLLTAIWALSEYHNAGGWPVHGFSQSSGIQEVWNFWIIYPFIGWVLITAASAWSVYGRRAIPESEIQREIKRQASDR